MFGKETFRCIVTTQEESVLAVDATSVVLPTTEGFIGILVNRAAFVATVGSGMMTIHQHEQTRLLALSGGVAHMRDNILTVVARECRPA